MDCSRARERILSSQVDDDLRAHLGICASCAELAEAGGRLGKALGTASRPATDPAGFAKITQITSEHDADAVWRLRSMPTNRRVAIAFVASMIGAVVYYLAWRRPDWGVYPMMRMGLVVGAMVIATAFGVVLSLPRSYRPPHPTALRLGLFAFLLLIGFVPALLPAAHAASASPDGLLDGVTACLGLGTLAALPAIIAIRLLQRDRALELWPTIFAALAAGVGANLALQMHCPIVDPMHLALGHAALGVLYAVLAWIVVRATVK